MTDHTEDTTTLKAESFEATGSSGKVETFYALDRAAVRFKVANLQLVASGYSLSFHEDEEEERLTFSALSIVGTASVEGAAIAVAGEPDTEAKRIPVSFRARDVAEGRKPHLQLACHDSIGWSIAGDLESEVFSELEQALRTKTLTALSFTVELEDLYSTHKYPSDWSPRYLKPRDEEESRVLMGGTKGRLYSIEALIGTVDLLPPLPPEPDSETSDEAEVMPAPDANTVRAVDGLMKRLVEFKSTMNKNMLVIVIILLIIAFK